MDVQTCLTKLKLVGVLDFATVDEEGAPQVRNISAIHFEGTDLYFLTARGKYFASQLRADGRVQILGYTKYKETIRLSGRVETLTEAEQKKWRDVLYREQPYLENVYPGETKNIDEIYVLRAYTISYFCLSTRPITRAYFSVGGAPEIRRGYRIGDDCIHCGTCQSVCPQGAISEGEPFVIDRSHCLECGNCMEHCPVGAIERY
ncbi:MAG: 4Fe-4S binding protein [Clostridia bacterium]|nr:4Fe-4S binding protein [Clostridia bacterium]